MINFKRIPDFEYISFKNKEDKLIITCWNGKNKNNIAQIIEAEEKDIKDFIINLKTLKAIQKLSSGDNFELNITDNYCIAKSSKGTYRGALSTALVPMISNEEFIATIDIDKEDLLKAIQFTSDKETKPILKGINIANQGITTTDSYKLFNKALQCATSDFNVTLDKEFISNIKSDYTQIKVANTKCKIVDSNGVAWYGALMDGKYPELSKLLKTDGYECQEIDFELIKDFLGIAINYGEKENGFVIVKLYTNEAKKLVIETYNYNIETDIQLDFDMNVAYTDKATKILMNLGKVQTYYKSEESPMILISGIETILLLPIRV